jgi:hypothetical protein
VVVLATILAATSAVPALAAARAETGSFPIEDHFVDAGASDACGFSVSVDLSGIGRYQLRFDANGDATNLAIHIDRSGTLNGNGVSLSEFDRINLFIDLQTGEQRDAGIEFRVSAVGSPSAIFDRGRLVFDGDGNPTFAAGPHPALDGDFAALCAALGG